MTSRVFSLFTVSSSNAITRLDIALGVNRIQVKGMVTELVDLGRGVERAVKGAIVVEARDYFVTSPSAKP